MEEEVKNIYMIIPKDYSCVYFTLLSLLSNLGDDLLRDCQTKNDIKSKIIIDMWNMFQTACAAYQLEETKKADTIVNYIKHQIENLTKGLNVVRLGSIATIIDEEIKTQVTIYCQNENVQQIEFVETENGSAINPSTGE